MKIYTKKGDTGDTALLGGTRISKAHIRIHAYGTVDELNSYVGLLADQQSNHQRRDFLRSIQNNLFTIGSILAADQKKRLPALPNIKDEDVSVLEQAMDEMDRQLPPLKAFLLPGGHQSVSFCHITRCVCRRAERLVIELNETIEVPPILLKYLNRLSDYFFMLSRQMGQDLGVSEIPWNAKS